MSDDLAMSIMRDGVLTPVTRYASGLRFAKEAQGGYASLSVSLALPQEAGWDLNATDYVLVTDAATADTVWDGYIEWPAPVDENGLRYYELGALGGQVLLSDVSRQHFYCDSVEMLNQESWTKQPMNTPSASAEVSAHPLAADPNQAPAIVLQFPEGKTLTPEQRVGIDYRLPRDAGRTIYRLGASKQAGATMGNIEARVYTWNGSTFTLCEHLSDSLSTSAVTQNAWIGAGTLASGQSYVRLQLHHDSPGVILSGDSYWVAWWNLHATAALNRKDGSWREMADYPNPGNYPALTADMIVEDLIARHLSDILDAPNAVVEPSTQIIDQFTRMDGVRDAAVLDSLTAWEPEFFWQIGPRSASTGKHSFAWRKWPTEPRYILPASGEFSEDGPDVTLCNRIAVRWRTHTGADRMTVVTVDVPELGTRTRDAEPVDLPDGYGSEANAQRIGAQVLLVANSAELSGSAVVRHRIWDNSLGRYAGPWEIESGELLWLTSRGRALRINGMEYDNTEGAATLRLGTEAPGLEQLTGALSRVRSDFKRKPRKRKPKRRIGRAVYRRRRRK